MQKAIFIDKDGTLIKDVPYNVDTSLITFETGVVQGLMRLKNSGYCLFVVSNQSGVALGYFKEEQLLDVSEYFQRRLQPYQLQIDGFYYCPHLEQGTVMPYAVKCSCRKPLPGLLLKAAKDFNIDMSASWMIGDILHDVEAGNTAGCKTVLINNGNETEWKLTDERTPRFIVNDFYEAASVITKAG